MLANRLWNKLCDWVFPKYTDFDPFIQYEWTPSDMELIFSAARAGKFLFSDDMEPRSMASVVTGYDAWGSPVVERVRGEFSL